MELIRNWCVSIFILSFFLSANGDGSSNFSRDSLDSLIRDYAFKVLNRSHSGDLNQVPIPSNFSGVEASVTRQRSGSLWIRGADFSNLHIPRGSIPAPFVKRIAIVQDNLGNWSSSYYDVPGYSLVTPVVGFLVYDASNLSSSNIRMVDLLAMMDSISISIPSPALSRHVNLTMKCVRFNVDGSVHFSEIMLPNVCLTREHGHFSIVVPVSSLGPSPAPAPSPRRLKRNGRNWKVWVIAFGCAVIGLILAGFLVLTFCRFAKRKKINKMEKQSQEGEALEQVWIGGSRMPSASAIRTQPVLENENAP